MLVLVVVRKVRFAQPLFILSLLLIMVGAAAPLTGQSDSRSGSVSVLAKPGSGIELDNSSAVDSFAKIENRPASKSASFARQAFESAPPFPDKPESSRELLVPQERSRDSFTEPLVSSGEFANELRGGKGGQEQNNVVTASFSAPIAPTQVRSEAIGTLATTNPSRQSQTSFQGNSAAAPVQSSRFSQPPARSPAPDNFARQQEGFAPPAVASFGGSTGSSSHSSTANGAPSVASQSFSSNSGSSDLESGNSASSNPVVSSASSWRRPDPSQSNQNPTSNQSGYPANRTASNQSIFPNQSYGNDGSATYGGSRFNANANSNYNQGINPNIAAGAPRVAPLQPLAPNRNIASQLVPRTKQSFNRDNSVRPTGFAQPTARRKVRTDVAKQLIARYSTDGVNSQELGGQPVKLLEMLNQPISTEQRQPMIHQFWDTYQDWASLVNAKQYSRLLEDIPGSSGADSAILEMAKMEARNEVLASEIELVKSQSKLAQYMPNRPSSLPPPIPNDLPLIQKYNTQYERYRQHQLMPVNLLGIDKMLPKTLELIASRAGTVQLAQSANQKVVAGVRNRQSSVSEALNTAKAWRAAERNLLVAVMDYNHAICDYALTISRGYQAPQQIVGMLIAKPKATNSNSSTIASRFRNARNTVGNGQPVNSQVNNQRSSQAHFNRAQSNQVRNSQPAPQRNNQEQSTTLDRGGFGRANSGLGNPSGFNQTNSAQGRPQSTFQQQPVSRTVEAGAASQFRNASNGLANPNTGESSVNRGFNSAVKSSQGFSLNSNSGFKPPAQNSFGGRSQAQFNPALDSSSSSPANGSGSANPQFQPQFP